MESGDGAKEGGTVQHQETNDENKRLWQSNAREEQMLTAVKSLLKLNELLLRSCGIVIVELSCGVHAPSDPI